MPSLRFFQIPPPLRKNNNAYIHFEARLFADFFLKLNDKISPKSSRHHPPVFSGWPPSQVTMWELFLSFQRIFQSTTDGFVLTSTSVGGTHVWEHRFNQVFCVCSWFFFTTHLTNMLVELDHFHCKNHNIWNHHLYRKFGGFQTRYLKEFVNCRSFLNQKFPKISSKRLEKDPYFFRKKNEENVFSLEPNPKIEDLMRNRTQLLFEKKMAFEERVVSCSSSLTSWKPKILHQSHEPTSSQAAELQNTTGTSVQVW